LALELALRRRHAYRDGLFIVDVSLCHEPLCITSLILEALGLQGDGFEALSSYLHDKQLLLVLDNCGHLAQASAQLVNSLLRHCPELHVLSASREALYLPSEQRWQLAPLPLPNGEGLSVDALLRCEAVALFLDHARLHHADFTLTPERAEAVVRICRQLEGLPLALELAAAKLSVLPVAQLAARLESSLGLLSYKSPVIPSRHWSFEGTVALLSEEERGLFACLSVFSGSFALEAVEALTTDPEVLERLAGLVSRSLVVVERERSPFRYRLLKPIRHYALGKLGAEEVRRLRDRHLEVYLALAEAAHQAGQPLGEAESQDLHAALAWALERGDHEKGLSLALALAPSWQRQNRQREGRCWLEAFLQAADLQPQPEEQARHGLAALAADARR
jgi:predicted ATPase